MTTIEQIGTTLMKRQILNGGTGGYPLAGVITGHGENPSCIGDCQEAVIVIDGVVILRLNTLSDRLS